MTRPAMSRPLLMTSSMANSSPTPPVATAGLATSTVAPLHHRDLIPLGIVVHLVHECTDQQQPAAGDALQVGGIGRVGQLRRVEARSLVANRVHRLGRRLAR